MGSLDISNPPKLGIKKAHEAPQDSGSPPNSGKIDSQEFSNTHVEGRNTYGEWLEALDILFIISPESLDLV